MTIDLSKYGPPMFIQPLLQIMREYKIREMEWFYDKMQCLYPWHDFSYDLIGFGLLRAVWGMWPRGVCGPKRQLAEGNHARRRDLRVAEAVHSEHA